jgi:hypothetical protein
MNQLSETAKRIIDNRLPGSNEKIFNESLSEFMGAINSYNDSEDLIKVIEYDKKHYLLPPTVCDAIFNRLIALGKRNSYILNWYSGILRMYGDPPDYDIADKLEAEAKEAKNKES